LSGQRARRNARGLVVAGALGGMLPGCFDGRLDTFEIANPPGGQAGTGAGTSGLGGSAGTMSAGTGGAVGSGGNAGSSSTSLLLDDFEDYNKNAPPDGWWYPKDDGTGPPAVMTFDEVTGRGVSRFAVHLHAGPTSGYGSFLGLDLPGGLFDASAFASLSFWARMEPAGELSVRFQDSLSVQHVQVRDLDATWREIRLPLAEFRSNRDGALLDPTDIMHVQFWIADTRPAYDLYVDDVWLLPDP
jgi:hypothetical protein